MTRVCLISNMNVDGTQFPSATLYSLALRQGASSLAEFVYPQLSDWDHYLALNGDNIPVASDILCTELNVCHVTTQSVDSLENQIITGGGVQDLFGNIHPIYQRKLMYNCRQFVGFLNCAQAIIADDSGPDYDRFVRLRPDIQYAADFRVGPYLRAANDHLIDSTDPRLVRVTGMSSVQHICPGRRSFVKDQVFAMTPAAVVACHANIGRWLTQMIADMTEYWDVQVEHPHQYDRWYSETAWGQLLHISDVSVQAGDSPNQPGRLLRASDF